MAEVVVLSVQLAMVGRDDDQRVFEQPSRIERGEEPAELIVQVGDPVVVAVDRHLEEPARDLRLVHMQPVAESGHFFEQFRASGRSAAGLPRLRYRGHGHRK